MVAWKLCISAQYVANEFIYFLIGFHFIYYWKIAATRHGWNFLPEKKERKKDEKGTGKLFRKSSKKIGVY